MTFSLAEIGKRINTSSLMQENPMSRQEEFLAKALEIQPARDEVLTNLQDYLEE